MPHTGVVQTCISTMSAPFAQDSYIRGLRAVHLVGRAHKAKS